LIFCTYTVLPAKLSTKIYYMSNHSIKPISQVIIK
jgi:hypothetical protein